MKTIEYSKQARKFLDRQTEATRERIITAINGIPERKGDIKRMEGGTGWRLRVGSYRVLFDENGYIIFISRIKTRGDAYKGGKH
ncbi:MAG: type II toxin-antitoxin system RelE/ParE family toxin [Synergistaceae bacterium]|nr:type II toxin-antitoxin system RelE/ParE family toxin [Synergistaceae bacterium]